MGTRWSWIETKGQRDSKTPPSVRKASVSEAATAPAPISVGALRKIQLADASRLQEAASDLAVVADAGALAVLKQLGDGACPGPDLVARHGAEAVDRLRGGGLLQGDRYEVLALTRRGRELWMGVRTLCQ